MGIFELQFSHFYLYELRSLSSSRPVELRSYFSIGLVWDFPIIHFIPICLLLLLDFKFVCIENIIVEVSVILTSVIKCFQC